METNSQNKTPTLAAIFWEFFKIALFVVGGGYAIIAVADNVFGRRLKWLEEGELLDHLPVFQMIPGIIAGNTAIYTGLKLAGYLGAAVALVAVALPSIVIFTIISCGYSSLPLGHPLIVGAFLGLRASLVGIIAGTVIAGWRKSVRGAYGYIALIFGLAALLCANAGTPILLIAAAVAGLVLEFCGLGDSRSIDSPGVHAAPLKRKSIIAIAAAAAVALVTVSLWQGRLFWTFVKFGLMCFGGGFVLIPAYIDEFVGPGAPFLNIPMTEFSDIMAITQMTPGPVSVNSATFFGYRAAGIPGAIVATIGLFAPSFLLLTRALTGLDKWRESRIVRGIMRGVKPATVALMCAACLSFAKLSLWTTADGNGSGALSLSPLACILAMASGALVFSKKISVMALIFGSAAIGAASTFFI